MKRYGDVFVVAEANPGETGFSKYQIIAHYWAWYFGLVWEKGDLSTAQQIGKKKRQPKALEADLQTLEAILNPQKTYTYACPQWAGHNPRFREKVWTPLGLRKAIFASQAVNW